MSESARVPILVSVRCELNVSGRTLLEGREEDDDDDDANRKDAPRPSCPRPQFGQYMLMLFVVLFVVFTIMLMGVGRACVLSVAPGHLTKH